MTTAGQATADGPAAGTPPVAAKTAETEAAEEAGMA